MVKTLSRGPLIWSLLILLGLIWGGSFPTVSVALKGFGPFSVAALRIFLAAIVLFFLALMFGHGLPSAKSNMGKRIWLHALGMAIFTNAVPFSLLSWGQLHVTSGFAGITMAFVPLVVLPLAHVLIPGEALTQRKLIGFAIGFVGVIILIGSDAFTGQGGSTVVLAQFACFGATICYAIGSMITRLSPPVPQLSFSAAALLLASVIMLPLAFYADGRPQVPTPQVLAAILYLGLVPTALATVLLVKIINTAGPSFLSLVNYQVPVWAALMGVVFLAEPLPGRFIVALCIILLGLAVSQMRRKSRAELNVEAKD